MTDTLISIISIFIGIIGANLMGIFNKKHSLGIIGNTITGVFGSIFLIKLFGRLGFGPISIMQTGELNAFLFIINTLVSFSGGAIGLIVIKKIKNKIDGIN